jgi:hypothetical protein
MKVQTEPMFAPLHLQEATAGAISGDLEPKLARGETKIV